MAKNKKTRREPAQIQSVQAAQNVVIVTDKIPLVSVIIPMYNSAKFIPQTLESLLYQTMTDFEVVVVDDCSTDNSVEVVESFAERFGGRLHVVKLPKNTGTPGLPRNVGIQFARGKYIAFLDSDDLFTKTALEELSSLAEEYQADVVHCDNWFVLWNNQKKYDNDPALTDINELMNPQNYTIRQPGKNVPSFDKPTFESEDILERVHSWISWKYNWANCLLFVKRDFFIENQIRYPNFVNAEDMLITFYSLCLAKKFLRVPNVTYVVVPHAGSVSREDDLSLDIPKFFHQRLSSIKEGLNEFEKFMREIAFFDKHKDYAYAVLQFFFDHSLRYAWQMQSLYAQIPAFKLNELVKKEFHPDDAPLAAYLFNTVNIYRLQIMKLQQEIAALKKSK